MLKITLIWSDNELLGVVRPDLAEETVADIRISLNRPIFCQDIELGDYDFMGLVDRHDFYEA